MIWARIGVPDKDTGALERHASCGYGMGSVMVVGMTESSEMRPGAPEWRASAVDWPVTTRVGPGLDGAVATETEVAWLDGEDGRVFYRNTPVESLMDRCDFEEVAFRLLTGRDCEAGDPFWRRYQRLVDQGLAVPAEVVRLLQVLSPHARPVDRLRVGISALGCYARSETESPPQLLGRLVAMVGLLANLGDPPTGDGSFALSREEGAAGLAHCLLGAMRHSPPSDRAVAAFDAALVAYADDGLEPLTFAGLIVESCHSDRQSALTAALCTATGPRAAGVVDELVDLFTDLPDADSARSWVRDALATGGRLPGFGHRILRSGDPRAPLLSAELAQLSGEPGADRLLEVARALETEGRTHLEAKGVFPNLNLYGAPLLVAVGVPGPLVAGVISMARCAGLLARLEEYYGGRIFRPRGRYMGPGERSVPPLEDR